MKKIARSPASNPALYTSYPASGFGVVSSVFMSSASPKAVADLDASLVESYVSGQTFADAMGNTAYDVYLGADGSADGTDPTFATNKFTFDGSQYFTLVGANPTLLNNAHKTTGGLPITIGVAFKTPTVLALLNLFGTSGVNGTYGFTVRLSATGEIQIVQFYGSANKNTTLATGLLADTWYVVFIAFDYTAGTVKCAVNARTFTSGTLLRNATTSDATYPLHLCTYGSTILTVPATFEYLGFYPFAGLLTDGELSAAIDILNDRHDSINIA